MLPHRFQDELSEVFIWKCSEVREEPETGDLQQEWQPGIQTSVQVLPVQGNQVASSVSAKPFGLLRLTVAVTLLFLVMIIIIGSERFGAGVRQDIFKSARRETNKTLSSGLS